MYSLLMKIRGKEISRKKTYKFIDFEDDPARHFVSYLETI